MLWALLHHMVTLHRSMPWSAASPAAWYRETSSIRHAESLLVLMVICSKHIQQMIVQPNMHPHAVRNRQTGGCAEAWPTRTSWPAVFLSRANDMHAL